MEIYIDDQSTVKSVQEDFTKTYPYLQLKFYREFPVNPTSGVWPKATCIKDIIPVERPVRIDVSSAVTTAEAEKSFHKTAGLSVQIFRRSGELWLQTTSTDDWTLEKQNEEGWQSTIRVKEEKIDFGLVGEDYS